MTAPRRAANKSAKVVAALKGRHRQSAPIELSTGVRVLIKPVSASVVADSQLAISDPPIPTTWDSDRNREVENPNHPQYIKDLQQAEADRTLAATDAILMMGVTLVDDNGDPVHADPEGEWIYQLRFLERHKKLSLAGFDLSEQLDLDFLYKKYIAVSAHDLRLIMTATGLTEEDIERARATFQDN